MIKTLDKEYSQKCLKRVSGGKNDKNTIFSTKNIQKISNSGS